MTVPTARLESVAERPIALTPSSRREQAATVWYHLRKNPLVLVGLIIVIVWVLISLLAPTLAPFDPLQQDVSNRLQRPALFDSSQETDEEVTDATTHLLGTDELGRDILTRLLYGGRITIPAGIAVIIFGSIVGTLIGSLAGYLGGMWDEVFMRITELFMAFPTIILALAVTAALGSDIRNAIIALVVVWWPNYARLVRGLVLEVKTQDYVEAVRAIGAPGYYILLRTILPNSFAPAVVLATLDIGNAILVFAGLSFLGLGPEPSSPEWGKMVSIGIDFFDQWWMWLFPGIAIASLVMAFNFIGDGMRDILDPRTR
ncbi:MAG: ABC transporter permease [Chloroflexi bacterium]|nr:MAG: D-ala-D-ala transporter subunit [Phototrophicales bacterium]RMF79686.1 MAG: ABC transporter permease [Chloroflexota bacterium]